MNNNQEMYKQKIALCNAGDPVACVELFCCLRLSLKLIDDFIEPEMLAEMAEVCLPEAPQDWISLELSLIDYVGDMHEMIDKAKNWMLDIYERAGVDVDD